MIKHSDGKIGTREFAALILITIGLKQTDITPSILFPVGKTATWLMPIISGLMITFIVLVLIALLKKYKDKNLIEVSYIVTGKFFGFLIGVCLFIFILMTTVIYFRSHADIMGTLYFPKTPTPFLLFLFLLISWFIANRGIEAIGRTSWLTVPYIKLAFAGLILLVFTSLQWRNIFPLAGPGFYPLMFKSTKYSYLFAEVIFFTILYPFVRSHKEFKLASLIGIGIATAELVVFYIVYLMLYDFPSIEYIAFPFQQLARIVDLGPIFGNTEAFFIGFWAIAAITRLAIYLFLTTVTFTSTLRIKEFEPLILPFAGVVFFLALLPVANSDSVLFLQNNVLYHSNWLLLLGLPLILWVVDQVKSGGEG
ncbi:MULTISPECIES: GerAB/ArcD/ProY family transporter [Bacillus]|uniref:GerAB/ArcD/ProY family transporter n=1 Tax=Bacillus TaxID=1386 RepID=UPI000BB78EF5|nr:MULTISPECIES: GerAB/ArcD/ProY family transporter [Bacillus]